MCAAFVKLKKSKILIFTNHLSPFTHFVVEIIPSINVASFEELEQRVRQIEPHVSWAHIDVSDGVFTKHISWHDSKELVGFETSLKLEVHLMIDKPEKEIAQWTIVPADRIIFHQEATSAHQLLIEKIHQAGKEAGIAIKPETPWLKLFPFFGKVEVLQLLAVHPGPSGQKFQEEVLHKIGHIRQLCPECMIEVDGGVDISIARRCATRGANLLVAGKAIFDHQSSSKTSMKEDEQIKENIKRLQAAITEEGFLAHLPGKSSAVA